MRKISTGFLIVLSVVLFVLSTSSNVVARANTDLGDLDTWVALNSATATYTPNPAFRWDSSANAYRVNVSTPFDGIVDFDVTYTWDDDHIVGSNPTGNHTFSLDVYVGGTSTNVGLDLDYVNSNKGTDGGSHLRVTATGVSVSDIFDCYLVATATDNEGTGYDSVSAKVIVTMI